eukprot:s786_g14.t1
MLSSSQEVLDSLCIACQRLAYKGSCRHSFEQQGSAREVFKKHVVPDSCTRNQAAEQIACGCVRCFSSHLLN